MKTLFFDTETTGLVKRKLCPRDPAQPKAVQIGLKLDGSDRLERAAMNYLVVPQGWTVDKGAFKATGISELHAAQYGIHLVTAVECFLDLIDHADLVIAHNIEFDLIVMRQMVELWSKFNGEAYLDPFEGKTIVCTMKAATPILKLPPRMPGTKYKWPKLEECIRYFFNESLDGAHDALVDVRGTARVYYHMLDMGVFDENFNFEKCA